MKTFLSIIAISLFGIFAYNVISNKDTIGSKVTKKTQQLKNPFIHTYCKSAFYKKIDGIPCNDCMKAYDEENQRRYSIIKKKWKINRGKDFDGTDPAQLREMLDIMDNYKICDYE